MYTRTRALPRTTHPGQERLCQRTSDAINFSGCSLLEISAEGQLGKMKITGYYTNDNHLFSKLSGSGGEEAKVLSKGGHGDFISSKSVNF